MFHISKSLKLINGQQIDKRGETFIPDTRVIFRNNSYFYGLHKKVLFAGYVVPLKQLSIICSNLVIVIKVDRGKLGFTVL